jgi:hypothetical protein
MVFTKAIGAAFHCERRERVRLRLRRLLGTGISIFLKLFQFTPPRINLSFVHVVGVVSHPFTTTSAQAETSLIANWFEREV